MLKMPEGVTLLCRTKKEGHGFKQECLSSEFRIYENTFIVCCACATIYTFDELHRINKERR